MLEDKRKANEKLRRSEEKFRNVFHISTDSINLNSFENGKYIDINEGFTSIMGYTREDVIGKTFEEIHIWDDLKDKDRLVAGLKKDGIVENLEAVFRTKNGKMIIGIMSARLLNIDDKEVVLSVTKDITDREQMKKQLRQSQKMEAIGTLAGGIAHDFNNLLFPILGHTEMLLKDAPAEGTLQNSLKEIYASGLRAKDLVQQILAFSRQEKDELMLMRMQPIIKETLKMLKAIVPTTIEITSHLDRGCGFIKADPKQIHQIVMNLATNAYHAMENDGGKLKFGLKAIEFNKHDLINPDMLPGLYACLSVEDTGKGMNKRTVEKIFDPFFTTKETGKGTGIGLSVVHGIVKSMKGAIQVNSQPGKGTEFYVYLPIIKSVFKTQAPMTKEPIQGGSERILLVDDEDGIIKLVELALQRLGYRVTSHTSSIKALEAFQSCAAQFDLVITDMTMPNIPGDKLAAELIKIRPDIPILLCTGFSGVITEEKIESLGIKGLLLKPIIIKDLAKKIRKTLDV